jgi:hypothetical protein
MEFICCGISERYQTSIGLTDFPLLPVLKSLAQMPAPSSAKMRNHSMNVPLNEISFP